MQIKNIITVSKFSFMATLAVGILFASKTDAATTTYFVDPTGNGCNAVCQQQIAQYFLTTGNVTNGPSNGTSTGTSTATSTTSSTTTTTGSGSNYNGYGYNSNMYPYLTYQYAQPATSRVSDYTYKQYPYMTYQYNTPVRSTNTLSQYVQYPMLAYVYYGQDTNAQIEKFRQTQGISNTYTQSANYQSYPQAYGNSNSGFTMTGGYGY